MTYQEILLLFGRNWADVRLFISWHGFKPAAADTSTDAEKQKITTTDP